MLKNAIIIDTNIGINVHGFIASVSDSTTLVRSSKPHCTVHPLRTFVYDHLLESSLGGSSLNDPLVNSVGSDKSIHHHGLSLTNAVTAILGLKVTLGILMGGAGAWWWREKEDRG